MLMTNGGAFELRNAYYVEQWTLGLSLFKKEMRALSSLDHACVL